MSYQRLDNFQTSLSTDEVVKLHKQIQSMMDELTVKKNLIHSHDYHNIQSHLTYVNSIFNNWLYVKGLESQNPYQKCQYNPYQLDHTVVHQGDGSTVTIVDERDVAQADWKNQFDRQVINPPVYSFPPSNIWNIQKIKNINL